FTGCGLLFKSRNAHLESCVRVVAVRLPENEEGYSDETNALRLLCKLCLPSPVTRGVSIHKPSTWCMISPMQAKGRAQQSALTPDAHILRVCVLGDLVQAVLRTHNKRTAFGSCQRHEHT